VLLHKGLEVQFQERPVLQANLLGPYSVVLTLSELRAHARVHWTRTLGDWLWSESVDNHQVR
jgi:hypothetical protein